MFPASLFISAAIIWASTVAGSFLRQSYNSLRAPGVSLLNHLAFASSTCASESAEFCFVTFSKSLIALIKCFGAPALVIFGLTPQ